MPRTSSRRLSVLKAQLCASSSSPNLPESAHAQAFAALPLPKVPVPFNYFDYDKFVADHGPNAKPNTGVGPGNPAYAKHAKHYIVKHVQPVTDARDAPEDSVVLDEQGFKLYQHPTKMEGPFFYDREKVESIYLAECAELVKKATGATRVMPFDYVVRNKQMAKQGGPAAGYNNNPHNDHTLVSGPRRVREMLGEDPVNDQVIQHRFAIMNVWRRWDGGNDWPLGACAYPSLDYNRDMVSTDLVYKHRTGETYSVRHGPNHRFFWWSDMTKDEAVILKIYDSDPTVARGSLHTGFKLPAGSAGSDPADPPRESMEVRCMVFWGPEEITKQATLRVQDVATNVGGIRAGALGQEAETAQNTTTYR